MGVASWENSGLSLSAKVTYETENFHCLCPKHGLIEDILTLGFLFFFSFREINSSYGKFFFNTLNWSEL